jgi:regulatory protein
VERVLAGLEEQGLLSDARFVEGYVEERLRKGFGPLRIRAELQERGIEAGRIAHGLELDEEIWMDVLSRAHNKKFGEAPPSGHAELARRARFLEYRGFTAAQVSRFLRFDD